MESLLCNPLAKITVLEWRLNVPWEDTTADMFAMEYARGIPGIRQNKDKR